MQDKLTNIFNLSVTHTYFIENKCTCLEFIANAATGKFMRRFDLTLRKRKDGFGLYTGSQTPLASFFAYVGKAAGQNFFDFDIKTTNPSFFLFTNLPADYKGQLTYSSNALLAPHEGNAAVLAMSLATADIRSNLMVGTLRIFFDDILKLNQGFQHAKYNIQFNARATQWQYYIINKSAVHLGNPSIAGKEKIIFRGPEQVTIPTGQNALLFSSGEQLIPLSELPRYKFDLVSSTSLSGEAAKKNNSRTIFKGLPNPNPERMGIITQGGQKQLSSPMYIYI